MRFRTAYLLPGVFLLLLGTVLGMKIDGAVSGDDTVEQLRKLQDAFAVIYQKYVEKRPSDQLAEDAIVNMIDKLDPHSFYIPKEDIPDVQEQYQGTFGGIGIWFEVVNDTARVTSVIPDGPSEAAGILAGDRIVAVNDSSVIKPPPNGITSKLKGLVGTDVKVTVRRLGESAPVHFNLTRGRIILDSIDSAYMLDPQTGYIKIGRFAANTDTEFMKNLRALQEAGMQRLIIDLRDNPGGIMESAVRIADEMLAADKTIVYTQGRLEQFNQVLTSTVGGSLETQPVMVLINENSASASEILAGALQDHDRALIVGRHTFGKALVQNQFELRDGSVLQMTISRYYTPSGRLIQTPYEEGDLEGYYEGKLELDQTTIDLEAYIKDLPDSLKYQTAHGRTVFGGGGILPDYIVKPDTATHLVRAVINRNLDVYFMREWFDDNEMELRRQWTDEQEAFVNTFRITETMWQAFWRFAEGRGIKLTNDPAEANNKEVYTRVQASADQYTLTTLMKARLAQQLYGGKAWFPIIHDIDHDFQAALAFWPQAEDLLVYHR